MPEFCPFDHMNPEGLPVRKHSAFHMTRLPERGYEIAVRHLSLTKDRHFKHW